MAIPFEGYDCSEPWTRGARPIRLGAPVVSVAGIAELKREMPAVGPRGILGVLGCLRNAAWEDKLGAAAVGTPGDVRTPFLGRDYECPGRDSRTCKKLAGRFAGRIGSERT